jgi:hypothetical protein
MNRNKKPSESNLRRSSSDTKGKLNRRQFLGGALSVGISASSVGSLSSLAAENPPLESKPAEFTRKIKLGVVGNGGRGAWIAKLFQKHGGYEMHSVADYFPLYEAGAERNIADFYRCITEGRFENSTVPRAVNGAMPTILSREATRHGVRLAMEDLIKENRRLELNLKGLKS